jgi:uncharacterized RDD family membrane protein YckC
MGEQQQWYYAEQGQQRGPVGLEDLRRLIASGQVTGAHLVWREGMPQWVHAGTLAELLDGQPPAGSATPLQYGQSSIQYYNPAGAATWYAGFWLRVAAYLLDYLILLIPNMVLAGATHFAMGPRFAGPRTSPMSPMWMISLGMSGNIMQWVLNWLYFALMESSPKQASLGKMVCGIIVTDLEGHRISFARATGRHFASWISGMLLCIGYMMAGWTEKKQALHDIIAGTLVVRKTLPQG